MIENKSNLLVTLNIGDLQQLIQESVNQGLSKITDVIKLNSTSSEDQTDELLTREQVSKLLKVNYTTLFNWNNQGILPIRKIKSRVYYLRSAVIIKLNEAPN